MGDIEQSDDQPASPDWLDGYAKGREDSDQERVAWRDESRALRQQLRGAVAALERLRDKAALAEKDPGGAMAASWVYGVADDALTDLGGR